MPPFGHNQPEDKGKTIHEVLHELNLLDTSVLSGKNYYDIFRKLSKKNSSITLEELKARLTNLGIEIVSSDKPLSFRSTRKIIPAKNTPSRLIVPSVPPVKSFFEVEQKEMIRDENGNLVYKKDDE